ncbi:hypothetical protein [Mesorhizobium sp. M0910]|uniref:hypothetical protein n=1 Tax=Mesorhizobium sp. M0910 TaxID=2957025 RepID=UPI00333A8335
MQPGHAAPDDYIAGKRVKDARSGSGCVDPVGRGVWRQLTTAMMARKFDSLSAVSSLASSARRPVAGDKVLQPSLAFFYDAVGQGHGTGESPMSALDAMPSIIDRIRHDLVGLKILINTALQM